ncbi:MAG: TSUP family transporter [Bacteroidota bacterium]|nr:TSUP family transporter [Bacteroidota bacterium]
MIAVKEDIMLAKDNNLFPVFLKLENLSLLIIGGGNVALEKLNAVLSNSSQTKIRLVSIHISDAIKQIAEEKNNIELIERAYVIDDFDDADIVIAAVNDLDVSEQIKKDTELKGKLVNVADKPELCDFYLGSIVKKGSVKIAISTNGKSPTIAKRLKEVINEMIPDEMENVLENMQTLRNEMNGNFDEKVRQLNDITKVLVAKRTTLNDASIPGAKKWQRIVKWSLLAFFFMILGHTVLSFIPFEEMFDGIKKIPSVIDTKSFLMMLLCGFLAQMADGSLGMGYGTISTTFLLANGVNPAIVSSRVHSARVFSSGVSGYSHHRFGNINKKLFKALVIPGVVGAIIGASLAFYAQKYSTWVRIPLSFYTIYLGIFIIRKAFKKQNIHDKVKRAGWLASAGGFMDAFAGGGWGSLVTSTLISKRKSPRYVVGSVCLAEFFVVLASSITFFIFLKSIPFIDVAGLIIGGLIAAPIAARLVGKLPLKTIFVLVGALVILTSFSTLWRIVIQLF